MNDFLNSFSTYIQEAAFGTFTFWLFPVGTLLTIWILTTVGLKLYRNRKRFKTVFVANVFWMGSGLAVAALLIGIMCFWWSRNYFSTHPIQLTLLLSLTIAMVVPIVALLRLRSYFSSTGLKELTDQPKTLLQQDATITATRRAFRKTKLLYIIPLLGFLTLIFMLWRGTNLISIVYDNSSSMDGTAAVDALSETFASLSPNNEITLTTLEGLDGQHEGKTSMQDIMAATQSATLYAGAVTTFANPADAQQGLSQTSTPCIGSPIAEGTWKTYLVLKETKSVEEFKNKLLIIMTDGADNLSESLSTGPFFFDDEGFTTYFPSENVFVIDYSNGVSTPLMQRFEGAGCDIFPASNKESYLDALDNALLTFKNNWFAILWTIVIVALLTLIGFLVQPKRIV